MKTRWQQFYSFFGVWKYKQYTDKGSYVVYYWLAWPWFHFWRKVDLFRLRIN